MEVKVKSVREQVLPGGKILVTIGELRFYKNPRVKGSALFHDVGDKLQPYFVSPNDANFKSGFSHEVPQPGDWAVDSYGDIITITPHDSQSFMKSCLRILVGPDQIPESIQKLIDAGMTEFSRVSIETELTVKIKDGSANDDVYYKIKFDKDNKVNVALHEQCGRILNEKSEPKATNNELLQLMHDTMSPVNSIKGAVFLLKPMIAEKLKENMELLGEIFTGPIKDKDDEFLNLLAKLLDGIETKSNQLNEVLDAYYVSRKPKAFTFTPDREPDQFRSQSGKFLIAIKKESGRDEWVAEDEEGAEMITTVKEVARAYTYSSDALTDIARLKILYPNREFTLDQI